MLGEMTVFALIGRRMTAPTAAAMLAVAAVLWLGLAPSAHARAPAMQSVGVVACAPPKQGLCATATWSLPPGVAARVLELAKQDPDAPPGDGAKVDRYGYFVQRNLITIENPRASDTSILSTKPLSPGIYYLHMGGQDPVNFPECPSREWSDTFSMTVTADGAQAGTDAAAGSPACPAATGGSGGGGGGGGGTTPDRVAPLQRLKVRPIQRVGKLYVSCVVNEAGTLAVSGTVSVPGAAKVYRLKTVKRTVAANVRVKIRVKLTKGGLRAARKALGHGKHLKAKLKITAKDRAGNTRSERAVVQLKR